MRKFILSEDSYINYSWRGNLAYIVTLLSPVVIGFSLNGWGWEGLLEVQAPFWNRTSYSHLPRTTSRKILKAKVPLRREARQCLWEICASVLSFSDGNSHASTCAHCLLLLSTTEKSLAAPSLHPIFRSLYTLIRSLLSLLFSRLNCTSSVRSETISITKRQKL